MKITPELVDYVAALARLRLDGEARAEAQRDLARILDYVDTLGELDTGGVEPLSHAQPLQNVFREDIPTPSLSREDVLKNAPDTKDGCFLAPQTFE